MANECCTHKTIPQPPVAEFSDLEDLWHLFLTAAGVLAILAVVVLSVLFLEGIL